MAALTSSAGPFFAKDSNGTMQKIKVIDMSGTLPGKDGDLIAGYAYVEATGSTYDSIEGSYTNLVDINSKIDSLAVSVSDIIDGINHITHSVDNNTKYVEQILMFNRATNVYTRIFKKEDLFDEQLEAIPHSLHEDTALNPFYGAEEGEDFMSKAVDVVIQNSTNKNLFLKIDYNPGSDVSDEDYTVKLLPGIIYNSESKIAHIRHKITFSNSSENSFVGEVPVSIIYNTGLNNDLSIGETTPGQNYLSSITTNYFNMKFDDTKKYLVSEWDYDTNVFEGMRIRGQARISDKTKNQELILYVTDDPNRNNKLNSYSVSITDEEPTVFDLTFVGSSAPVNSGRYELIAVLSGSGEIGDARVLFADLIRYARP